MRPILSPGANSNEPPDGNAGMRFENTPWIGGHLFVGARPNFGFDTQSNHSKSGVLVRGLEGVRFHIVFDRHKLTRSGAVRSARQAHILKVVGSNPSSATSLVQRLRSWPYQRSATATRCTNSTAVMHVGHHPPMHTDGIMTRGLGSDDLMRRPDQTAAWKRTRTR